MGKLTSAKKLRNLGLNSNLKHKRGIALIITLTIMTLLMVTLSNTFENTALEIKMVNHEENEFLGETITYSTVTALFLAFKSTGVRDVFAFARDNLPEGVPVPILGGPEDGSIANLKIQPIDHYFYINTPGYERPAGIKDRDILVDIFNIKLGRNAPPTYEYYELIGQMTDMIDSDENPAEKNFLRGSEIFPNSNPYFKVKNQKIDYLSELRLLPKFQSLGFSTETLEKLDLPLRVHNRSFVGCKFGPLNVNFLPNDKNKIQEIISNYSDSVSGVPNDGTCQYEYLADKNNTDVVADLISERYGSIDKNYFTVPLSNDDEWGRVIESIPITAIKAAYNDFFTSRSELFDISYEVYYGSSNKKVDMTVQMIYPGNDDDKPKEIKILSFSLN